MIREYRLHGIVKIEKVKWGIEIGNTRGIDYILFCYFDSYKYVLVHIRTY